MSARKQEYDVFAHNGGNHIGRIQLTDMEFVGYLLSAQGEEGLTTLGNLPLPIQRIRMAIPHSVSVNTVVYLV